MRKVFILAFCLLFIVACTSTPTNVSEGFYNEVIKIQNYIDDCFNDNDCNEFEVNEVANESLLELSYSTEEERSIRNNSTDMLVNMFLYKGDVDKKKNELKYKKLHNDISEQLGLDTQYLDIE